MKSQCDKHGCSELLCGCSVEVLEEKSKGEIMWAVVEKKEGIITTTRRKIWN